MVLAGQSRGDSSETTAALIQLIASMLQYENRITPGRAIEAIRNDLRFPQEIQIHFQLIDERSPSSEKPVDYLYLFAADQYGSTGADLNEEMDPVDTYLVPDCEEIYIEEDEKEEVDDLGNEVANPLNEERSETDLEEEEGLVFASQINGRLSCFHFPCVAGGKYLMSYFRNGGNIFYLVPIDLTDGSRFEIHWNAGIPNWIVIPPFSPLTLGRARASEEEKRN